MSILSKVKNIAKTATKVDLEELSLAGVREVAGGFIRQISSFDRTDIPSEGFSRVNSFLKNGG